VKNHARVVRKRNETVPTYNNCYITRVIYYITIYIFVCYEIQYNHKRIYNTMICYAIKSYVIGTDGRPTAQKYRVCLNRARRAYMRSKRECVVPILVIYILLYIVTVKTYFSRTNYTNVV